MDVFIFLSMNDLSQMIKLYSARHKNKINEICSPLSVYLNIPVFTYYCIEADGRFVYITNAIEFHEFYFQNKLYVGNPYFGHPALFRSGQTISPCTMDEESKKILNSRFKADHFFLTLNANEEKVEGFIFANENVGQEKEVHYIEQLGLLEKFGKYFKNEAKDLIGKMHADQFNALDALGKERFEAYQPIPLSNHNPDVMKFLKAVTGLSRQELRCLELFKQGKSAQGTAAVMEISPRTVESYFESIKNKLGCSSKYDLLNF